MKQVIVYVEPERHAELKQEAKLHRRSLGQQLLVKAFGLGLPSTSTPTRKRGTTIRKGASK